MTIRISTEWFLITVITVMCLGGFAFIQDSIAKRLKNHKK